MLEVEVARMLENLKPILIRLRNTCFIFDGIESCKDLLLIQQIRTLTTDNKSLPEVQNMFRMVLWSRFRNYLPSTVWISSTGKPNVVGHHS